METDSRQSISPDASVFPGIEDLKKLIEKFQLPSVDIDALIDWQRRDMEAMTGGESPLPKVSRRLWNDATRSSAKRWRNGKRQSKTPSPEAITKRAEAAKQGVQKAIEFP